MSIPGSVPGQRLVMYARERAALTDPSPLTATGRPWRSAQVRISVAAMIAHPFPTCSMIVATSAPLAIAAQ